MDAVFIAARSSEYQLLFCGFITYTVLSGYQANSYLPIIRSVNESGTGGPKALRPAIGGGALAGTGPYSNAMVST